MRNAWNHSPAVRQAIKKKKARFTLATLDAPVTATINKTSKTNLLDLPVELRLTIYNDVVMFKGKIRVSTDDFEPFRGINKDSISLLQTCKLVRDDVTTLFYRCHTFVFISVPAVINFQDRIGQFVRDVQRVQITPRLARQKAFTELLPAFFETYSNVNHFTVAALKRFVAVKTYHGPLPSKLLGQLIVPSSTHFEKAKLAKGALEILKMQPKLASGTAYYSRESTYSEVVKELRFMPSDVTYDGAYDNIFPVNHSGKRIAKLKMPKTGID